MPKKIHYIYAVDINRYLRLQFVPQFYNGLHLHAKNERRFYGFVDIEKII
jgi:hypothetical protein